MLVTHTAHLASLNLIILISVIRGEEYNIWSFSLAIAFIQTNLIFYCYLIGRWSRVAQSAQCLATDWTTGRSRFDPRQRQKIFPLASVSRPALGAHPASCPMGTGVLSPGVKRGRGVTLTIHLHLVPRSWMSRSYTSSPPTASMACSGTALSY
jgi:hypothetical protein